MSQPQTLAELANASGQSAAISTLVFDVNETLLDIHAMDPLFERLFGDSRVLHQWFNQLILYSGVVTFADAYLPFSELGAAVLRMVGAQHGLAVDDGDIKELADAFRSMPAHPEVAAALERLRLAGFRLVSLSNSAFEGVSSPLEQAGIGHLFERQLSVDAVRKFKPAPDVYQSTAEALDLEPAAICMVAAHIWDTIGAQHVGYAGAFVARPGNAPLILPGVPQPQIVGDDLDVVADRLIALWGR